MTETIVTEPADYVNALLNVASLLAIGLGKKPVLLIDEGEAFGNLTNADAINEIVTALRRLLSNDNTVLGIVMSVESDGGMERAPAILTREELASRIDYEQGYVDLTDLVLVADDAKNFIVKALELLIDPDGAKKEVADRGLGIEPEYYPFSEEGVDQIATWVTAVDDRASPRQIMAILAGAIGLAWKRRNEAGSDGLVTDEMLDDVMHPEERE
jgi:hypothetical protein